MDFTVRKAVMKDYESVVRIMNQVQQMHVNWRPDIYKANNNINSMAVDEKYRGLGIGHLFFEKVKQIKEQKHCDGIELQVNSKNQEAYEMYSKYGFTVKSINMELL